jgi:hypothetical protein
MAEYFVLRQLSQNPRHAEQPENSGANTYSRMLMWVHNELTCSIFFTMLCPES